MSLVLRPYQEAAALAPYGYWEKKPNGNPLIVLPTGGGKSLVLAKLCKDFIGGEPETRIVMATHVKELIEQNYAELLGEWPFAPAGVFSASLGRRDAHSQIIFGGIATMYSKVFLIGHVDILIVDEAHLIPREAATMYGQFITALKAINPNLLILGLTATPYRVDSGMLTDGDDALFDDIIFEISIKELMDLGYLCPLSSKGTQTTFDLKGVGRNSGDFKPTALQKAVDKHPITQAAVAEAIGWATSNEKPRNSWLFFCAGVDHALHVRDEIRAQGYTCEAITNDTEKGERKRIIEAFKAGKIRSLTNANVLTTGFNAPRVDLLVMLRPTESTALYVQMVGRGTRCIGANIEESIRNGKADCLVLDFAGNVRRHGPVDRVKVRKPGKGEGDAPVKECPGCHELIFAGLAICPACGHVFERDVEKKITKTADAVPILSTGKPNWLPVKKRYFHRHDKPGGTPSIRVEYLCGMVMHKEWICPEHQGFARVKFEKWWKQHSGKDDAPFTIDQAFSRAKELRQTQELLIKPSGKHWEIVARKLGEIDPDANELPKPEPSPEEVVRQYKVLNQKPAPWDKPPAQATSPQRYPWDDKQFSDDLDAEIPF